MWLAFAETNAWPQKWPGFILSVFKITAKLKFFFSFLFHFHFSFTFFSPVILNIRTSIQRKKITEKKKKKSAVTSFSKKLTEVSWQNDALFPGGTDPLSDVKWLNCCFTQKDSWLGFQLSLYLLGKRCLWLPFQRERRKAEERIYVHQRLKDRVLKWPGKCSELTPASHQVQGVGATGKKQKKNQCAVKELLYFSRKWPFSKFQGSSSFTTALKPQLFSDAWWSAPASVWSPGLLPSLHSRKCMRWW